MQCRRLLWQEGVTLFWLLLIPENIHAYVDPGTTGMLSQLLYLLFYGVLGVFLYSIRHVRTLVDRFRARVLKAWGRSK